MASFSRIGWVFLPESEGLLRRKCQDRALPGRRPGLLIANRSRRKEPISSHRPWLETDRFLAWRAEKRPLHSHAPRDRHPLNEHYPRRDREGVRAPPSPTGCPPLAIEGELAERHAAAVAAIRLLRVAGAMVLNPGWLLYGFVRKEAVLSSQIEGTQATLRDIATFEATNSTDRPDDVEEVCNYVESLNHARAAIADPAGLPLSTRLLCDVHRILMRGVRVAQAIHALIGRDRARVVHHERATITVVKLLDLLPSNPVLTVLRASELLGITAPPARKVIDLLEELGVLHETIGKQRDRVYAYHADLELLTES